MTTLSVQRVVDNELTSAQSATLMVYTSTGTMVISQTIIPLSPGVYSHETIPLSVGRYTAVWTFTVAGQADDVVNQLFQVDSALAAVRGISLAQLERDIARRVGPYWSYGAALASDVGALAITKLMSTIASGDYEDLFILRRGRYTNDTLVTNFNPDDRVRQVSTYNPENGILIPDRQWAVAPQLGEAIELHGLHPDDELRPIALAGLARCYFWDTAVISVTTTGPEISLSDILPWITRPAQVRTVQFGRAGYLPSRIRHWRASSRGSDVYLQTGSWMGGGIHITALRPHATLVNNELSLTGPNDDTDILYVEPVYAARAGHIAAWELFPDRLTPLAAQGLRLPMKMVADAFTVRSMAVIGHQPELLQHQYDYGYALEQFGNLPELPL